MLPDDQFLPIERFARPPHPIVCWLGKRRLRVLRWRDRHIPWQMRHFYYHHKNKARIGTRVSLGLITGHFLCLILHTVTDMLGLPLLFPSDVLQAGAMLIPGFSSIAQRITLQRGKRLYHTGEAANEIMVLVEGYGRLCMEHEANKCLTVGLVAPGDLFGEEALLDVPERESAFEAVLQSQVDIIARAAFTTFVSDNPALLRTITVHLAQRLLTQQRHMARLAFEPLEQRLAWILLELASATGTMNTSEPTIPIYHKDLAAVLGVWRETITATLNRWAIEGLIAQQPGHLVLKDTARLHKLADDTNN
ncbi:MAG: Crp/Fnr family transcriptional regulator [Ktedonobacteraceae bacterium]